MKHSFDRKGWGYGYQTDLGPASGIHFHIGKIKINQHIIFFFFFFQGGDSFLGGIGRIQKDSLHLDLAQAPYRDGRGQECGARHLSQTAITFRGSPCICLETDFYFFFLSVPEHTGSTLICSSTICPFCLFKDRSSMMLYMGLIRSLLKPLKAKAFWIAKQFPLLHLVREHFFLAS